MTVSKILSEKAGLTALLALFTLVFTNPDIAESQSLPKRKCGGLFGLCGYVDDRGKEVIARKFQRVRSFSSGLAAVRHNGLWGYITAKGDFAIPPRFEDVSSFTGSRARVRLGQREGVIDRQGEFVIPPNYVRVIPLNDDVALVEAVSHSSYSSKIGSWVHLSSGKFQLFHRTKGLLTERPMKFKEFHEFKSARVKYIWASEKSGRELYGLMDLEGRWVVEPRFSHVHSLHDGRAIVGSADPERLSGAVDAEGKIVIPLQYEWLGSFQNDYALVGRASGLSGRRKGLIRRDGKVVIEPVYDDVRAPSGSGQPFAKKNGIWFEVQKDQSLKRVVADGTTLASCPQGLRLEVREHYLIAKDGDDRDVLGLKLDIETLDLNKKGANIRHVPFAFGPPQIETLSCHSPIVVKAKAKEGESYVYTYLKPDGSPLFNPLRFFPRAYQYKNGHAIVAVGDHAKPNQFGIINGQGVFTLPLGPLRLFPYGGDGASGVFAFARGMDKHNKYIDEKGQVLESLAQQQDRAKRAENLACKTGLRVIGDGDQFGLAGPDGKVVIPARHRGIICYDGGVAWVSNEAMKKWCPIGPDGEFRQEPACTTIRYPKVLLNVRPEALHDDEYESSILWTRAYYRYGMGIRDEPPGYVSSLNF